MAERRRLQAGARRAGLVATVAASVLLVAGATVISPAGAAVGMVPPRNPAANVPSEPNIAGSATCTETSGGWTCTNPCLSSPSVSLVETPDCTTDALRAIDVARAGEGVGPLVLPSDWSSLTAAEQLFVVTDEERVDRGLPPYVGLVATLSGGAQQGAADGGDPNPSAPFPFLSASSIWAANSVNPLAADYEWMYADGYGGSGDTSNVDCGSPSSAGCWGHRDAILGYGTCADCVAGAGFAQGTASGWGTSFTELFVRPAGGAPVPYFSWSADVAPDLGGTPPAPAPAPAPAAPAPPVVPPEVGMAATRSGDGYWEVAADGGVFSYGDAAFLGSMGGHPLDQPIVGMAAAPTGNGYWEVGRDGGIFCFGGARFYGSMGGQPLDQPIVGMAAAPTGHGYWEVGADGGIFAFGVGFFGSVGGHPLNRPVVGVVPEPSGAGYWMVGSDGGIFAFGAGFYGSRGG
ncbi:MAG: hypothetical protein ACRDY3_05340 [Acidimicrobiales bacterium]